MKTIQLSIGSKIYTMQCNQEDASKIYPLAKILNISVNKNAVKYRGLSADNLFLITVLEIVHKNTKLEHKIQKLNSVQKIKTDNLQLFPQYENNQHWKNPKKNDEQDIETLNVEDFQFLIKKISNKISKLESEINSLQEE